MNFYVTVGLMLAWVFAKVDLYANQNLPFSLKIIIEMQHKAYKIRKLLNSIESNCDYGSVFLPQIDLSAFQTPSEYSR